MATTLENELLECIEHLNEEEKRSVLQMLKTFLRNRSLHYNRVTIEQYNRQLEKAERQIEAGNYTTQEDLEKEMEQW